MSTHKTHRTRLARTLAAETGVGYQKCLQIVVKVSDAGLIPAVLDDDGIKNAVRVLKPLVLEFSQTKNSTIKSSQTNPVGEFPPVTFYPGSFSSQWDSIPIGVKQDGKEFNISLSASSCILICSEMVSDRSAIQRLTLFHALTHPQYFQVIATNLRKTEFGWLKKYPQIKNVTEDLESTVRSLNNVRIEMLDRHQKMKTAGVNNINDLPEFYQNIICMVDDLGVLLNPEGIKSNEGRQRDRWHSEAAGLIGEISRLGKPAGIHIFAGCSLTDMTMILEKILIEFKTRIICETRVSNENQPKLNSVSDIISQMSAIQGRAVIRDKGIETIFQRFQTNNDWYDQWLIQQHRNRLSLEKESYAHLKTWVKNNSISEDVALELAQLVSNGANLIIGGGTGAGKTSLLDALTPYIPKSERVAVIEDVSELHFADDRMAAYFTNDKGVAGDKFAHKQLTKAIRTRSDRIIVGELRNSATLDFLQAMNTGHNGCMATLHTTNIHQGIRRLSNLVESNEYSTPEIALRLIKDSVDIMVIVDREADGERRIVGIYEIPDNTVDDSSLVNPVLLWEWQRTGITEDGKFTGRFVKRNHISENLSKKFYRNRPIILDSI